MGVERTSLFFDIFARLRGNGLKDLEREAERAEDALDDLDGANRRLSDSTPESIRRLRAQKDATRGVADASYQAKHALDSMSKGRHRLEDVLPGGRDGDRAGHGIGVRIGSAMARGIATALVDASGTVGRAIGRIPPQIQAGLVAGLATLAIPIGAALNGIILAALGSGVVAAGVALAVRDPRVKQAGASLGAELLAGLETSAKAFVPATLGAIADIRSEFRGMSGEIGRMFDAAAAHVQPLTRAVTGFVREMLPGITEAMRNIGPVMNAVGDEMTNLGRTLGDTFALMSTQSEGAAQGLRDLFLVLRIGVSSVGVAVAELSLLRSAITHVNEAAQGPAGALLRMALGADRVTTTMHAASDATSRAGAAAAAAGRQMRDMAEAQRAAANAARDEFAAETQLAEAIARSREARFRNNAGIDASTKKGRANRDMLQQIRDRTIAATEATMSHSRGVGQFIRNSLRANATMREGATAFIRAAMAMGVSEAKARALARRLGLIPPAKNVAVRVTTGQALSALRNFANKADAAARPRVAWIRVRTTGSLGGIGSFLAGRALGGPVEAGRPYVVGEKGPEVIVPDRDGTVVPNNRVNKRSLMAAHPGLAAAGAGGITVNVNAGYIATPHQLRDELTNMLAELQRRGRH